MSLTYAQLFSEGPIQYGLRGDAELWKDLARHLGMDVLPATPGELEARLRKAYRELAGRPLEQEDPFYLARYDRGGMSRGMISPPWWQDRALPLLLERYARLCGLAAGGPQGLAPEGPPGPGNP